MAEPTVAPLAHHPRLTPVGGGIPNFHEGRLVGGIGGEALVLTRISPC
ncbi:uncharacterized protein GlcG (DUF336 family) [Paraburkholderia sp. WSM4179]|nr:uncharacterized protein GlcG (DUF336 family) [Paraburkholderia sp. WSM4179]